MPTKWPLLFGLLVSITLRAQPGLRGLVTNGETGEPLAFANVFLSNTTKGALTDEKGRFVLPSLPSGRFELVVSYVGFETLVFTVQTDSLRFYRIGLKPTANELAEVRIKARRGPEWKQNLALFLKIFIGRSQNAAQCRLLNPTVLWFNQDDEHHRLTAGAREPLLIENRALGYRVKYQLESFLLDVDQQYASYVGYPVLEPLSPRTPRQQSQWVTNRRKTYAGSVMHFMRALYRHHLSEEGFVVQRLAGPANVRSNSQSRLPDNRQPADTLQYDNLVDADSSTARVTMLKFREPVQVTYLREKEEYAYRKYQQPFATTFVDQPQTSTLRMLKSHVLVEANGHFSEPTGVMMDGYWSWKKIAELLPLDYEPGR